MYLKIVFRLSDLKINSKMNLQVQKSFYKLLFKHRSLYFDVWLLWSSIEGGDQGSRMTLSVKGGGRGGGSCPPAAASY